MSLFNLALPGWFSRSRLTSLPELLSSARDELLSSFRQMVANEGFKLGPVTLKNPDLNRVHSIVTELDSRRVFYAAYDDEFPDHVMESVFQIRSEVKDTMKGVWADPSVERIIQEIMGSLNDFVTKTSRMTNIPKNHHDSSWEDFVDLLVDLRLNIWLLVAYLKLKTGDVIQPSNLPEEIWKLVNESDFP